MKIVDSPRTWADEVEALFLRDESVDVAEFEALMAVALRPERPDDDRLPQRLPQLSRWRDGLTSEQVNTIEGKLDTEPRKGWLVYRRPSTGLAAYVELRTLSERQVICEDGSSYEL